MRINSTTPTNLLQISTTVQRNRTNAQPAADQVRISARFDNSYKVDQLTAAVASGTYRVSSWKIAGSMIGEMLADYH